MTPATLAQNDYQRGIKRVVCAQDYHASQRSKEIFKEAGIDFVLVSEETIKYTDQ